MKKTLFIVCALFLCIEMMAQKYLDVYQNGLVSASFATTDIDSIGLKGNSIQDRMVTFYREGHPIHSFLANSVDSIKVYRPDYEPMVYLGIVGFNQELFEMPFDILQKSTSDSCKLFVSGLNSNYGSLLYYALDHALDMLTDENFTTPLTSVNLITFTDGLDQGSLMMNGKYVTDERYLDAMSQRINTTKLNGLPITAYSLGLRGNDVTDYEFFKNNLNKLASSSEKAFEVSNMNDVQTRLKEISDQIICISNRQTFSFKIPGQSDGTLIRFTFDGSSTENSSMYIEGTFNLVNRSLDNVRYHGIKATSGSFVQGTQDGIFVTFTFTGMQREDGIGLIPTYNTREFYKTLGSNTWQRNSEFSPNNNTQTTITHSGSVIMLVLDCSKSLGSKFDDMKNYVNSFIGNVSSRAYSYEVSEPKNVSAFLSDDYKIRISWDAVKNADSYDLYRSNRIYSPVYELVAKDITTTSWIDNSVYSGDSYKYGVCAKGHFWGHTFTSDLKYISFDYWLSYPLNVNAYLDEDVIKITWDAVKGAERYVVGRSTSSSGMNITIVASDITSTSCIDETPNNGKNYYWVCAVGHGMESKYWSDCSDCIDYKIEAPKNVKAFIPDDEFGIKVIWDAVKYAESYDVYRSESPSSGFMKVATEIRTTSWIDEMVAKDKNYYYRVCVVKHGVNYSTSDVTDKVSLSFNAPTNVIAEYDGNLEVVNVSWDPVKYAECYEIYRNDVKVGENVVSTKFVDVFQGFGMYSYKVCAKRGDLVSDLSESANTFVHQTISVWVNNVGIKLVKVDGGTFNMGATSEQSSDAFDDEKPVHQVTLSDYYIGETEVTQELWQAVMGSNPSKHSDLGKLPVETVSWEDCQEFIKKLNALTGYCFRLPTEAEWEFAARGGTKTKGYRYAGSDDLWSFAWFAGNSNETHEVGTKAPNELGLYDMSGNVSEWCQDWYGWYGFGHQENPTGPSSGPSHVVRNGNVCSQGGSCRVSYRCYYSGFGELGNYIGLRLALSSF